MAQIFHPSMNTISRVSIFGAVFILAGIVLLLGILVRSPYMTEAGVVQPQPVPFSHAHHVGDIGIDCRYCHTSVETAASAGMPSTQVCLNCHRELFSDSPLLAPVHASERNDEPLRWTRVHDLPDYSYFHHGIHVKAGIGCTTCHGEVDEMPLMYKEHTLHMEWCLDCHRNPEKYVRPRDQVFAVDYEPPEDQDELGEKLVEAHSLQSRTNCSYCHR